MPTLLRFPGRPRFRRKGLVRLALCLACLYAAVILILLALEDAMVFHPYPASHWVQLPADCDVHDFFLTTCDGVRVHARWCPRPDAWGAVLVCHTRAGNLSTEVRARALRQWQDLGLSLLVFDYPGYGKSDGRPSEAGCYAAAVAAYDWLTDVQGVPAERLVVFGRSLGTAVAVDLASRRPHRALVLVSPFTSMPDVSVAICPLLPARQLQRNRFDSLKKIGACAQPLLIVHGTCDALVPFDQGKRLFAAAAAPKRFVAVEGADHNRGLMKAFFPAVRAFLEEAVGLEKDPDGLARNGGSGNMAREGLCGSGPVHTALRVGPAGELPPHNRKASRDERHPDSLARP